MKPLRSLALMMPLAIAACAGPGPYAQGPLQPQAVSGPCQVSRFFLLRLTSVHAEMTLANAGGDAGQACRFTLINPALQVVLNAALVTIPPRHGEATATVTNGRRQAEIAYAPLPGYAGPDTFSVTLEPDAVGVTVAVTVQDR